MKIQSNGIMVDTIQREKPMVETLESKINELTSSLKEDMKRYVDISNWMNPATHEEREDLLRQITKKRSKLITYKNIYSTQAARQIFAKKIDDETPAFTRYHRFRYSQGLLYKYLNYQIGSHIHG